MFACLLLAACGGNEVEQPAVSWTRPDSSCVRAVGYSAYIDDHPERGSDPTRWARAVSNCGSLLEFTAALSMTRGSEGSFAAVEIICERREAFVEGTDEWISSRVHEVCAEFEEFCSEDDLVDTGGFLGTITRESLCHIYYQGESFVLYDDDEPSRGWSLGWGSLVSGSERNDWDAP